MTNDPNSIQHGGDHYKRAGAKQHWDMVADLGGGWEYYLFRASAYLTRVKDTELDPKKAGHFLDKLLNLVEAGRLPTSYVSTQKKRLHIEPGVYAQQVDVDEYLREYFAANNIDPDSDEATAITLLSKASTVDDVRAAREVITRLAHEEPMAAAPTASPTPAPTASPTPAPTATASMMPTAAHTAPQWAPEAASPAPAPTTPPLDAQAPQSTEPPAPTGAPRKTAKPKREKVMTTGNTGGISDGHSTKMDDTSKR